ncbi:hypothetical protein TRIP_D390034 [uncultured Paludibacter sp.]|nr:hypothetical protein TRIP_D390034 [uncultured Paludibacter sp.]
MKIFSIISCFLIFFVGCESIKDFNYNDEYIIQVTKSVKSADNQYEIRFDSVFTDSRCPEGAVCVWEGVAGARFTISEINSSSKTVELYTLNNNQWSDSAVYNNLKIKLLELNPYPSVNSPIKYSDYKAKIKISRIN